MTAAEIVVIVAVGSALFAAWWTEADMLVMRKLGWTYVEEWDGIFGVIVIVSLIATACWVVYYLTIWAWLG